MFKYLYPYLLLMIFFPLWASAQREADNWVVESSRINFNGGNDPTTTGLPFNIGGACSTVSDKNGNLLFFTNGVNVYDKNYNIMPALLPNNPLLGAYPGNVYAVQSALILPFPSNDSLYYIFYVNAIFGTPNTPFYYAVVNMKKNNGLGDVVQRDVPLLGGTNVCVKQTAIFNCNKKDIWLVGHLANSDKYFSLLINSSGISTTPIYSTANTIPNYNGNGSPQASSSYYGTMKISPVGNKLAAAHLGMDFTELCDFDAQTGQVSNPIKIFTKPYYYTDYLNSDGPFAVDFSPSGERLYISSTYATFWPGPGTGNVNRLDQFNTTLPTAAQIQSSKFLLDTLLNSYTSMQIANNGKMYINSIMGTTMCVISNPEGLGNSCNYTAHAFSTLPYLSAGNLPNFNQSYFRYPLIATGNCQFQNINFSIQNPTGISAVTWNFGDPASGPLNTSTSFTPTHIYTTQGIYDVTAALQDINGCANDTIHKRIFAGPFKVFLGNDVTLCQGDTLQLKMNIPGASNFWSNNTFDTVLNVTQSGTYWVRVSLGDCSASDTIVVSYRNSPQFTLGKDSIICNGNSAVLSPNPSYPTANYLWSNNATAPTITVSGAGAYWLRITDNFGCKWQDTVNISYKTLPNFSLGPDASICQNDTLKLNATVSGANAYLWNTGAVTPTIKVYQSDIYWCDVSKDGCIYRDSLILTVKPLPIVNLGNDTTLCEDKTLLLNATNPNASYLWQDGNTTPTYLVTQNGQYQVTATLNSCIAKDMINITYDLKPKFTLGPDRFFCINTPLILDPQINGVSYLWQDGSTNKTYIVTQPGLYFLSTVNNCGTSTDSVILSKGVCDLYIPNAFSPSGKNKIFKVEYGDNVTEFQMQIFNRYGQLIFETKDKAKGWDGNFNAKEQPQGTYVWAIRFKTTIGSMWQNMQGTIILLR